MPHNVQLAAPTTVLPYGLWTLFEEDREWAANLSVYASGEAQGVPRVDASRARWRLARKAAATQALELRAFYVARKGPTHPFYVYIWSDDPVFSAWDATGASTDGRRTVRFDGAYSEQIQLGRTECNFGLIEIF